MGSVKKIFIDPPLGWLHSITATARKKNGIHCKTFPVSPTGLCPQQKQTLNYFILQKSAIIFTMAGHTHSKLF